MIGSKLHHALKPDAQAFDEIRIVTTPRYKESELSGDEWRISATIQFWRKGRIVHQTRAQNVERACAHLAYHHDVAIAEGKAMFGGEAGYCDQEGCSELATVAYRIKKGFSRDGSERHLFSTGEFRQFCDRHKTRGDCGLEDADTNYEQIERQT